MQSIHKSALALVGILLIAILAFGTRIPLAHAATTVPPDISGTWQGQGNYNSGQNTYNMLLTITSVNGSTFSGTLEEDTFNSTVAITGSITNSSDSSSTITFTDPSTISGSQIQLNCTYIVTVSNGQMSGAWYYSGDSSPDGTIVPSNTPTPDFSPSGTDAQSAQMTSVQNQLSPLQRLMNSDQFNQLVGLVLSANDYKTCAADLAVWSGTEGVDMPTNTSDACAPVAGDIQDLLDQLQPQKVY